MIVYQATKERFLKDAFQHDIDEIVRVAYQQRVGRRTGKNEIRSWRESLTCMAKVLSDDTIPGDCGVAIEFVIPQSSKRIDFILTGMDEHRRAHLIIVELKQWESAQRTEKDAIVKTWYRGGYQEVPHPSYQAWSYAALLKGFNEAVYAADLELRPCAYLHNYLPDDIIAHRFYQPYIEKAPLFLKGDDERGKLREFIRRHVKYGDAARLLYTIENGRIRPSKSLVDALSGMLKGNQEFILIDDQKLVYESALAIGRHATAADKRVLVVEGGPGTGKSVIAVNLLVAFSKLGLTCKYVSKNAAPRAVYESKLTGVLRKTEISNLFCGSGVFVDTEPNTFDVLIVDEAHRLNERSGLYRNLGENQVKELIAAAKATIFFVDEDQQVTLDDIGSKKEIIRWAAAANAKVAEARLASQFRCGGSDGYLAWLDNTLQIRDTANEFMDTQEFDFRVFDSPEELRQLIVEKNKINNAARMVAGYCWPWNSKKHPDQADVVIPSQGFSMQWNLASDGSLWIVAPTSVDEIGCIHTSQGLEVDYIGVVVGPDLIVRNGRVVTRPEYRASSDRSVRGYKRLLKQSPVEGQERLDRIIKNTYRALMTRGMKGCYVYFTDAEAAQYFRSRIAGRGPAPVAPLSSDVSTVPPMVSLGSASEAPPLTRLRSEDVRPYENAVPVVDLKCAAGVFGEAQTLSAEGCDWVELPALYRPMPGLFAAQVVGESINRRIPSGSWCLFKAHPTGTKQGRVVIAQHRSIHDPELGGAFTLKVYFSEKVATAEGSRRHRRVILRPDSDSTEFPEIVLEDGESVKIVAELISVLV